MRFKQYITEQNKFQIFMDMDGVLTDFEASFKNIAGNTTKSFDKLGDNAFWDHVRLGGLKFWSEMPWIQNSKNLWNFVKKFDTVILSAPARTIPDSPKGKKIWIKRELGNVKLILKRGRFKHMFAGENKILIDDKLKIINKWKGAGGIGIHFKSAEQAMKELKKIIK